MIWLKSDFFFLNYAWLCVFLTLSDYLCQKYLIFWGQVWVKDIKNNFSLYRFWRFRSAERSPPPGGRSPIRTWCGARALTIWLVQGRCCCSASPVGQPSLRAHHGSLHSHTCRGQTNISKKPSLLHTCLFQLTSLNNNSALLYYYPEICSLWKLWHWVWNAIPQEHYQPTVLNIYCYTCLTYRHLINVLMRCFVDVERRLFNLRKGHC